MPPLMICKRSLDVLDDTASEDVGGMLGPQFEPAPSH